VLLIQFFAVTAVYDRAYFITTTAVFTVCWWSDKEPTNAWLWRTYWSTY